VLISELERRWIAGRERLREQVGCQTHQKRTNVFRAALERRWAALSGWILRLGRPPWLALAERKSPGRCDGVNRRGNCSAQLIRRPFGITLGRDRPDGAEEPARVRVGDLDVKLHYALRSPVV